MLGINKQDGLDYWNILLDKVFTQRVNNTKKKRESAQRVMNIFHENIKINLIAFERNSNKDATIENSVLCPEIKKYYTDAKKINNKYLDIVEPFTVRNLQLDFKKYEEDGNRTNEVDPLILEFYSIYLGFIGFWEGEKYGFDIKMKIEKTTLNEKKNERLGNINPYDLEQIIRGSMMPLESKIEELQKIILNNSKYSYQSTFNNEDKFEGFVEEIRKEINYEKEGISLKESGLLALQQKDYQSAKVIFEQIIKIEKINPRYFYFLANIYIKNKENKNAISLLEKAIEFDKENAKYRYWLGGVFFDETKYGKAIIQLEKATELDKENAEYWSWLGKVFFKIGNYNKAIRPFKKAIELDKENAEHWFVLGAAFFANNNFSKGIKPFEKATELDKENAEYWSVLGRAFIYVENDYYKAIKPFEKATEFDKENAEHWSWLGVAFFEVGNYNKAIEPLEQATELDKNNAEYWYWLGRAFYLTNNCSKAVKPLEKATELDKENAEYWYWLGRTYYAEKNYTAAIKPLDKSTELDKENAEYWFVFGVVFNSLKNNNKAQEMYKNAIEKDPNNLDYRYGLGWLYFEMNKIDNAKEQFIIIIKKDKKYKHAYTDLGHCELILENRKESIKNYKKSVDLWNCSQEFFKGFKDDWKHIKLYGVPKEEYDCIKQELRKYCSNKK